MCTGVGGAGVNNCVSVCNAVDTLPMNAGVHVATSWHTYCTYFYPNELCAEAEAYVTPSI